VSIFLFGMSDNNVDRHDMDGDSSDDEQQTTKIQATTNEPTVKKQHTHT
jgi:hypothetical protein